jgi:hypothetical protein
MNYLNPKKKIKVFYSGIFLLTVLKERSPYYGEKSLEIMTKNEVEKKVIFRGELDLKTIKKGAPAWLPSFRHRAFESDILSHLTFIIPNLFLGQRKI